MKAKNSVTYAYDCLNSVESAPGVPGTVQFLFRTPGSYLILVIGRGRGFTEFRKKDLNRGGVLIDLNRGVVLIEELGNLGHVGGGLVWFCKTLLPKYQEDPRSPTREYHGTCTPR